MSRCAAETAHNQGVTLAVHALLRPALEAARRALRDLDPDQVPADLRKVVAYTGGKLPPPLAKALLLACDRYPWLVEKAVEAWPEADVGAGGFAGASALFLLRPEGWEVALAELAAAEGEAAGGEGGESARRDAADAKRRLEVLAAKLKDQERAHAERVAGLEAQLTEARSRFKERRAALARDERTAEQAAEAQRRAMEELGAERDELARRVAELADDVAAERRSRREAERAAAEAAGTASWSASDPIVLAGRLDEVARMARPRVPEAEFSAAGTRRGLRLPSAVRPDSPEAIAWLMALTEPVTVLVDGYNVGFRLTGDRRPGPARDRLLPILDRLQRLAAGSLTVFAVFDSSEQAAEPVPPMGRVKVFFTSKGRSADDEIADLAAGLAGSVVVVTSDRALREAVEAVGAQALWSESVIAWSARR